MSTGPKRSLVAAVAMLTVIGAACSSGGAGTAPSTPQEQATEASSTAPAEVIPVPPGPAPSIASAPTSTPRPTNTPATSAGPTAAEPAATTEPTATAEPTATSAATVAAEPTAAVEPAATVEQGTSSPAPTATSMPVTSTPNPPSPTPEAEAPGATIISSKIENFSFEDLEIGVGTIVSWFNKDGASHTVTAGSFEAPEPGVFNSGALSKGEQYSFVFHEAGSYQFYCVFHPRMEGTITVVDNP